MCQVRNLCTITFYGKMQLNSACVSEVMTVWQRAKQHGV